MNAERESGEGRYPIRVVAQRTGLSAPVIRAWERRYGSVMPARSDAGQRVYSAADIERLQLLATLVESGRGIGSVADLPTESLEALVEEELTAGRPGGRVDPTVSALVPEALDLVERLRSDELERLLVRAAVTYGAGDVIHGLMLPLLREIGSAWAGGRFGAGSEHVASVTIRGFLEWLSNAIHVHSDSPLLLTGTPAGQHHEFGALLAGLVAADEGWGVQSLGPDLPGDEIVRAARSLGAEVVALSAIYPALDEPVVLDVISIRENLPDRVDVVIGGPAVEHLSDRWSRSGILSYPSLDEYRAGMARIRRVKFGAASVY